jgi:hypothetical protein
MPLCAGTMATILSLSARSLPASSLSAAWLRALSSVNGHGAPTSSPELVMLALSPTNRQRARPEPEEERILLRRREHSERARPSEAALALA